MNFKSVRFLALLLLPTLTHAAGPNASPSASPAWSEQMRGLYKTLAALMTDVSSEERFKSPKHRKEIEANAKKLADLAHNLKDSPDKDPSVQMFASLFADGAKLAYRSFKAGNLEYSRALLRTVPGYCIACHTRTHTGPDFARLPIEPAATNLRPLEVGEFYASTRQYDRALAEFSKIIEKPEVSSTQPLEWSHAVKYALAIAVRVKQDPVLSRSLIQKILGSPQAPFFVKEDAKHWLESVDAWSKEGDRKATNEEGLYSEAVRLLGQAHDTQKYPVDHSADVLYLRASAAVHDLLQLGPNGRYAGEGYLMAGLCYEVLSSFHIGELQDIYYEACVRLHPHTKLSSACYRRYEESIYFGYTGSSGTHLPQEERDKLKILESMATETLQAPEIKK